MKKIFIALMFLLALTVTPVIAADGPAVQSLTFEWEQSAADLNDLAGWSLLWSPVAGSGYVKVVDIAYNTGVGPTFTTTTTLNVTGTQGGTVMRCFVLTANSKSGVVSGYSNEACYNFVIPFVTPSAPFKLIIKVNTK